MDFEGDYISDKAVLFRRHTDSVFNSFPSYIEKVGAKKHNFKIASYLYDIKQKEIPLKSHELWITLQLSNDNLQWISNLEMLELNLKHV